MRILLFLLSILFCQYRALAQDDSGIGIRFLNAAISPDSSSGKDVVAVFLVSVKDSADFPPVVNLPPKCTVFERGREKVFLLRPDNLAVSFDDGQIEQKNPRIYALIKDKLDLKQLSKAMIVSYDILDIYYDLNRMSLSPSFKNKHNQAIKTEKRFEFDVK